MELLRDDSCYTASDEKLVTAVAYMKAETQTILNSLTLSSDWTAEKLITAKEAQEIKEMIEIRKERELKTIEEFKDIAVDRLSQKDHLTIIQTLLRRYGFRCVEIIYDLPIHKGISDSIVEQLKTAGWNVSSLSSSKNSMWGQKPEYFNLCIYGIGYDEIHFKGLTSSYFPLLTKLENEQPDKDLVNMAEGKYSHLFLLVGHLIKVEQTRHQHYMLMAESY